MRVWAWWLMASLVACGKVEPQGDAELHAGGKAGASDGSGGSPGGDGSAANGGSGGRSGAANTNAGSSSNAGSGSNAGAQDVNEAGSAGSAGSPVSECGGEYEACGCGCCAAAATTTCYYPERGDSLEAIQAADQNAAASPSCASTGCVSRQRYVCCRTTSELAAGTAYQTSGGHISGEIYRMSIRRSGADQRCQYVHIARGDGPSGIQVPIALPTGWIFEVLTDYACKDESSAAPISRRSAIGGLGYVRFVKQGPACELDYDFTLFFASSVAGVDPIHFAAHEVVDGDLPECN